MYVCACVHVCVHFVGQYVKGPASASSLRQVLVHEVRGRMAAIEGSLQGGSKTASICVQEEGTRASHTNL